MRLLIVLYPWLELLSLIQLGVETSALFAILWVVGMFFLGTALLRHVGMASLARLREAQRSGGLQQTFFVDDLALCIAAVLLMIPGLLSDFFAVVVWSLADFFLSAMVAAAKTNKYIANTATIRKTKKKHFN